jgi:hypothetical protein
MRRRFCEGEGLGCPPGAAIGILVGEPTEPERTAEQNQVVTQEMEIVLNPCAISQQYPSAIAGSSWGSALGDRLSKGQCLRESSSALVVGVGGNAIFTQDAPLVPRRALLQRRLGPKRGRLRAVSSEPPARWCGRRSPDQRELERKI